MKDLTRRQIRYICFRLQIEADGGNKAKKDDLHLKFVDEVKEHMEGQADFGGWLKFGKTWDVDEKAPLVVVLRSSSIQSEWNKVLLNEARELPKPPEETAIIGSKGNKNPNVAHSTPLHGSDGKFISKSSTPKVAESKKKVSGQS